MTEFNAEGRMASVQFTGTRSELFGILFRGYLLMLPTIGIYRFWNVTWKRRFYWHNTVIDGDPLEYTGNAMQLLIGFLFALAFFLPIYIGFFYLSTQAPQIAAIGYGVVAAVLWYLMGYAIYRARDFRLSRTLWRGIRFDLKGSAWGYANRRFGWSILMVLTAGLVYPFMVGNLFRYRYLNSYYGDRQFGFTGSWRKVAGPFYLVYFGVAILTLVTLGYLFGNNAFVRVDGAYMPRGEVWLLGLITALVLFLGIYYYRSRVTSRMFSSIKIGDAGVIVKVRARSMIGQLILYILALTGAGIGLLIIGSMLMAGFMTSAMADGQFNAADFGGMLQTGWVTAVAAVLGYLVVLATMGILGEVILGYGYWMLVARGAIITNADSLMTVRATAEDLALHGEGLADALNVGAY
jgi:uncharacterized membrane protein YjgN (DUF898 family)